jgi:hypothetical protein
MHEWTESMVTLSVFPVLPDNPLESHLYKTEKGEAKPNEGYAGSTWKNHEAKRDENNGDMLVRKGGFEPPRLTAPPPQDGASASSATSARGWVKNSELRGNPSAAHFLTAYLI